MPDVRKEYGTAKQFLEETESALTTGGILVETRVSPSAREKISLHLVIPGKGTIDLEGEVVYSAPTENGFSAGLELSGEAREKLRVARDQLLLDADRWGKDSKSLQHEIADMTTSEKIQRAIKGNREERKILMKDTHYMVHPYVLKNPRITTEEVSDIAKSMSLTGEMIITISNNTEWMGNMGVRLAIVKNPKTAIPIVQKHINKLNDSDLMNLAKSENVRDAVSNLAIRALASRGKTVSKRKG